MFLADRYIEEPGDKPATFEPYTQSINGARQEVPVIWPPSLMNSLLPYAEHWLIINRRCFLLRQR